VCIAYVNMKIIICLFGVIPRSIKWTYASINTKIIKPLKTLYDVVDIYGCNMKTNTVDGVIINQDDMRVVPFTHYDEIEQDAVDEMFFPDIDSGKIQFMHTYPKQTTQNALRQMYTEYKVGCFLENHQTEYDVAIALSADQWIANNICIEHIQTAAQNNVIYLSDVNPGYGFTNGFYFGKPAILIPLLKRYDNIDRYFPCNSDYEYLVAKCICENNIEYAFTKIVTFKIRANKVVHWQGFFRTHFLSDDEKKQVYIDFYMLECCGLLLHYYAGLTPETLRQLIY
jgi:hypothetical protein